MCGLRGRGDAGQMLDLAPVCGLLAALLGVVYTVPYARDTLRGATAPHRGSWLIWSVIEVVAVASQAADGARWSLVALASQAACTCLVFGLSVRHGRGGISRVDLTLLALVAITATVFACSTASEDDTSTDDAIGSGEDDLRGVKLCEPDGGAFVPHCRMTIMTSARRARRAGSCRIRGTSQC